MFKLIKIRAVFFLDIVYKRNRNAHVNCEIVAVNKINITTKYK